MKQVVVAGALERFLHNAENFYDNIGGNDRQFQLNSIIPPAEYKSTSFPPSPRDLDMPQGS
jgi:hypothetical protein